VPDDLRDLEEHLANLIAIQERRYLPDTVHEGDGVAVGAPLDFWESLDPSAGTTMDPEDELPDHRQSWWFFYCLSKAEQVIGETTDELRAFDRVDDLLKSEADAICHALMSEWTRTEDNGPMGAIRINVYDFEARSDKVVRNDLSLLLTAQREIAKPRNSDEVAELRVSVRELVSALRQTAADDKQYRHQNAVKPPGNESDELFEDGGKPSKGMNWKEAAALLEQRRTAGKRYTSCEKLAKSLGCSSATIHKAIDRTQSLRDWATPEPSSTSGLPSIDDPKNQTLDKTPQSREPDPADIMDPDDVDLAMEYLIYQAESPEDRAKLDAMDPASRRRTAQMVYDDPERSDEIEEWRKTRAAK
jgi:hypothetical protein